MTASEYTRDGPANQYAGDDPGGERGESEPDESRPDGWSRYRCHGCGFEFGGETVGAARCPRCGCIGDHDRTGALAGATDGGP
ncbi:hypothetical protein [Halosimplex salinum]|uniref:hypothetical protein n=1 Tax=Halosimplex salinum TaxID=1710538 RepID=UPI000F49263D|nr:hypothetical protein [Halosimplex salinum]